VYAELASSTSASRREEQPLHRRRHEDVFHISRNSELYCSRFGVRPIIAGDMSIITLDGDEHVAHAA
jgi:hypothetical protein